MLTTLWHILYWATIAAGTLFVVLETLWSALRRLTVNSTTAAHETTRLGKRHTLGRVSGNAVVAGGSVAGLATAVVCSKFFERVIVIEPDSMDEFKRTRVAQAEQIHGLQAIALQVLRGIIPGFDSRLYKHGGRILESNGQLQLGPTNINFKPVQAKGCDSQVLEFDTAVFADCTGPATIGLRLLEKTQNTGWGPYPKTSYDPKISYATALIPVPDRVKDTLPIFTRQLDEYSTFSNLGYVKSIVPHPEQDDRIVCMVRSDENHLMCGVGGWDLSPESRPRSFSDYIQQVDSVWQNASDGKSSEGDASRMAVMDSLRAIEAALLEDQIVPQFKYCKMDVYKRQAQGTARAFSQSDLGSCYKIDYANAPKPSNFVVIGDSFLRVNPTFGQGISKALVDVATLNGVMLDTILVPRSSTGMPGWSLPATFSDEMFAQQIPRVMHMWDSTKGSDYGRTGTELVEGETSQLGEFGRNYWRRVIQVASRDKNAAADIIRSLQLIAPPLDLLRPSLFIRAMWYGMKAP
ncbi:unnamed protein product [Rhizoctonia solani]|uniref:FAD-binding domain-containing protein n=1 Tax=Rhizoctonia solani TaxID=456999 RepID=A0A8H3CGM6_9AGAM|nr:unnamed protein product [Rhizoctonia solani]